MEIKIEGSPSIPPPEETYEMIHRLFYARHEKAETSKEHLWRLSLDAGLKPLAVALVSIGGGAAQR